MVNEFEYTKEIESRNFTAEEIKALQTRANSIFEETLNGLKNVQLACFSMSSTVASGDSDLSEKWDVMGQTIADKIKKANELITNITTTLENFVQQTVENEKIAEELMNSMDHAIGEKLNH